MLKKNTHYLCLCVCFILLSPAMGLSWNGATIKAPKSFQTLDYEPVSIHIKFRESTAHTTMPQNFKAWLNHQEITHLFEPAAGGVSAEVTPEDGLKCFIENDGGTIFQGMNFLKTSVTSGKWKMDRDYRLFFVKKGSVNTTRDEKGVWYIEGSRKVSPYYVFQAMGYAMAEDRLWQMELYRRQARGTLAEVFGESQIKTDVFMRTLGYSEEELEDAFAKMPDRVRTVVKGYVFGINKRIGEIEKDPSLLPFEFSQMGITSPAPWTILDILAWTALMQRHFDPEALDTGQTDNMVLLGSLSANFPGYGMDMFNDLRWTNDPEAPTYILEDSCKAMVSGPSKEKALKRGGASSMLQASKKLQSGFSALRQNRKEVIDNLKKINAHIKMGSYAWVLSGDHTTTGNPIIYSGPQMGFSTPSIVCEGSIQAGGLKISGMTVPGIPGIVIGRTPHHAWSMQVGHAHTTDYYIESDESIFLHREETIKVRGMEDIILPVYRSQHGPVVEPLFYNQQHTGPILSWKYAHWGNEFGSIEGFLDLAKAKNMNQFGDGIAKLGLSQHFCYADKKGNIAYWMSGKNPVRPPGEWRLPQGAIAPPLEWDAEQLMPCSTDRNPERGYYAGWNNKTHPGYDNCSNSVNDIYGPFHRAHVIYDYLDDKIGREEKLSYEEVRDLALYIASTDSLYLGGNPWKFVDGYFTAAVMGEPEGEKRDRYEQALEILENWDGHFVAGGPEMWATGMDRADAWILMDAWIRRVMILTFGDELGELYSVEGKETELLRVMFNALIHGLAGEDSAIRWNYDWFSNKKDDQAPQTPDQIIVQALEEVLSELEEKGARPWGIGARGEITYTHDMLGTVHSTPFSSRSTYAHCVEYGPRGPVRIESMFPLGESGTILTENGYPVFDPNFHSMAEYYDNFLHREFPLFK